mgnify:CR=1 FL=1
MPIKVLKASAGSGKTYTLANEYLDLLRNSLHSKILAVTFTNKAARELKERAADNSMITATNFLSPEERSSVSIIEKENNM